MKEKWKPVPDYPFYEVSNMGNVRSLDRWVNGRSSSMVLRRGRILKPSLFQDHDYYRVTLSNDEGSTQKFIHVLVAHAFIGPPPPNKPLVRHKNDNGLDNRLSNLVYGDHQDNMNDRTRNGIVGGHGELHPFAKLSNADVLQIRRYIKEGYTATSIAECYSIAVSVVSRIKHGVRRTKG